MTDDDFTYYRAIASAQIASLRVAILALIASHPDKPTLSTLLQGVEDQLTAMWLPTGLSEDFLNEFQHQMAELKKYVQSA